MHRYQNHKEILIATIQKKTKALRKTSEKTNNMNKQK